MALNTLKNSSTFNKMATMSIAAVLAFSGSISVASAQCRNSDNAVNPIVAGTSAFFVRKLQSDMMVAALGCGMRQQYNMFATSYRAELKHNSVELLSMFAQQHGAQAKSKHTSFLTSMANDASLRMASTNNYCVDAQVAMNELTSSQNHTLEKVAATYFTSNGVVAIREDDCPQISSLPAQ